MAAVTCYYVAARQTVPVAQHDLADMLLTGDGGVNVDLATGLAWLEKAAMGDFVPAQTRIALDYEAGTEGAPLDMDRAAHWYKETAWSDDAYAQYKMARVAWDGLGGLPKDSSLAFEWLGLALYSGFQGSHQTMNRLLDQLREDERLEYKGTFFAFGLAYEWGVPGRIQVDLPKAVARYRRADSMGHAGAARALDRVCRKAPSLCG